MGETGVHDLEEPHVQPPHPSAPPSLAVVLAFAFVFSLMFFEQPIGHNKPLNNIYIYMEGRLALSVKEATYTIFRP